MGASSVTGVGPGDAECVKGPGNRRNFWVPQVTTHVVTAGHATVGGSGTVVVPIPRTLNGGADCYVVLLTPLQATDGWVSAKTEDSDGNFIGFTISGSSGDDFEWAIIRVHGMANDFIDPECSTCAPNEDPSP
jgi:hypothetical protein